MTSLYGSWVTRGTTDHQVNSLLSKEAAAGDGIEGGRGGVPGWNLKTLSRSNVVKPRSGRDLFHPQERDERRRQERMLTCEKGGCVKVDRNEDASCKEDGMLEKRRNVV
jgi:hypothetical protein